MKKTDRAQRSKPRRDDAITSAVVPPDPPTEGAEQSAAILQATRQWRTTLDALREAVCLLDGEGRVLRCNRAMQQWLGRSFEQITGRHCWELIYGRRTAPPEYRSVVANGTPVRELRRTAFTRQLGDRWFEITLDPVSNEAGALMGTVHVMADITDITRAEDSLRQYAERLRMLRERMTASEEQQRLHLARELHDRVGQLITAIGINLTYLRDLLSEQPTSLLQRLDDTRNQIEDVSRCIRDVMLELRPMVLDDYGLSGALRWYAERFGHRTGIEVTVHDSTSRPRLPGAMETALFRIAEEAFTNISKHAKARAVKIKLALKDGLFSMEIVDNGVGFDPKATTARPGRSGWGLMTMQERAVGAGARFHIASRPNKGTTIRVDVRVADCISSGYDDSDSKASHRGRRR